MALKFGRWWDNKKMWPVKHFAALFPTATASSGAATLNEGCGTITSEALTTAAGATYTLTLTNGKLKSGDVVFAQVDLGAGSGGTPVVTSTLVTDGQVVIVIQNIHASAAFNAAIRITFLAFRKGLA